MGTSYSISGEIRVRDCEAVREVVAELEDEVSDGFGLGVDEADGVLTIEVQCSTSCSYTWATELGELLKRLGPHAVEAGRFDESSDMGDGTFYVGTDEQVAAAVERAAADAVLEAFAKLSPARRKALLAELAEAAR